MLPENDSNVEGMEQIEQEARTMGWVDEEHFKGEKEKWINAEEFVEKGRHVMPILVENNKRLQKERLTQDAKIATLGQQLANAQKAIDSLEKHYTAANKRSVEIAKSQIKEEIKAAREAGDVDAELALVDKLDELKVSSATEEPAKTDTKDLSTETAVSPDFAAWEKDNPWFGGASKEDRKKTKEVIRIGEDLKEEGSVLTGRAFFDECTKILEERLNPSQQTQTTTRSTSKVEGGNARSGSRGGVKSFADLPQEAKQACWDDVPALVGSDKRYKTQADWEKGYAKIYFGEA